MSVTYRAIGWNPQKRAYDWWMAGGILTYLATFVGANGVLHPFATIETVVIRASGTLAFLLLHVILSIGPLCRLDSRFLPLLYNRRHLGVTMFLVALVHGTFTLIQFHALGDRQPLVSLLTSSDGWLTTARFPFQIVGAVALMILFAMAATSHDFWLRTLSAPVWKALHMLVYTAYALIVVHVVFGALQSERHLWLLASVICGMTWVVGIHLVADWRERRVETGLDRAAHGDADPYVEVCGVADIPDGRARIVCLGGERVAVFRYGGLVSAMSNVCQHQNGPLGEGRIVRGCVVCPWHGYEYLPDSGMSPPPFTERVPTFAVQVRNGRVFVDGRPHPAGTRLEPARIENSTVSKVG